MADEVKVEEKVAEEGKQAAASSDKDEKGVPFSDHPRWREVYGAFKEYKEIGLKPNEVRQALAEADQLKAAFREAAALAAEEARKSQGEKAADEQTKLAREQLRKIFPEIDELTDLKQAQEAHNSRLEQAALSETRKVMGEVGLDTDKGDILEMSDILADVIKNDAELMSEYGVNPKAAVRGAWTKWSAKFEKISERAKTAKKQESRESAAKLPKAHGGGNDGGGGGGGEGPPKTLKEATERAIKRLAGMEM